MSNLRRALLVAAVLVAAFVTYDVLVVTDEERIEAFVETITGTVDEDHIAAALAYFDPARVTIDVEVLGRGRVYSDAAQFRSDMRRAVSILQGDHLRALGEHIEVTGDTATVTMRLVTQRGIRDTEFRLVKRGEDWLVSRVRVM
ncbi:MAG: hypothetical protein R3A78_14200 [Polyangiales bacterium]|nr:hypothetical protein [Myxococcales bacterium]